MENSPLDKIKTWKMEEINVTHAWQILLIDATIHEFRLTQFIKFLWLNKKFRVKLLHTPKTDCYHSLIINNILLEVDASVKTL